jgi:ankyrin repeat protein
MNWQDNNGNTAAHAAIKSGNMAVYRFLNSHQLGVDVNIPNNKGETAAELAFHFRKNKLQQKLQGLLKEKQILSQRHGLFDGIRRQYLQSKIDGLKLKLDQLMIEKMRLQTVM